MRRRVVAAGTVIAVFVLGLPRATAEPPTLAVETYAGRVGAMTPYLQNLVYRGSQVQGRSTVQSESFRPFLANERSGWGTDIGARLVNEHIFGGLEVCWFDVSKAVVHHRGRAPGHPEGKLRPTRIRTDGTVDDSGVEYRELDDRKTISIPAKEQFNLFVFGLEGGYRFYLYSGSFDVYTPLAGSLVVTHVGQTGAPFRPGLGLRSGASAAFDFVSIMSLVVGANLQGMVTPTYWNRNDAARRAAELGHVTESALFSTQLSASLNAGLRFNLR